MCRLCWNRSIYERQFVRNGRAVVCLPSGYTVSYLVRQWYQIRRRGRKLRENIENWNTINTAAELAQKSLKWRFKPPSAPHQSSIWEKLVGSLKQIPNTIVGTLCLKDEVLNTTFCLAEYASNALQLTFYTWWPSKHNSVNRLRWPIQST